MAMLKGKNGKTKIGNWGNREFGKSGGYEQA
ncbi:MAG: coiled-coil 11..32 [Candidatus Peribacter riflensis]|nr:MAG: hypothetical protein PeribacterB2_0838 [Candidatus Peribacter riflensis]ALM12404.1 MAG: hypothetical protein PeribacterC2_0837 [Candidatus Peribacter riflensis]ALM14605.1 MAG: coiled-coil 11..32 [Candidatus Peribacter riflensis]